ncbi:MAG: thioesterase family protein [Bacteroidaceae bacterium]|nr:thioesterase family protein [Bacteroidaceae bacterium]
MIETGLTYTATTKVTQEKSALAMGSGNLMVFATPALVALMENAAMMAVAPSLPEGSTTVGGAISIQHTRPSGMGQEVSATARLVAVDGRKLSFELVAHDSSGVIGEGTHVRFIVDAERFMAKVK